MRAIVLISAISFGLFMGFLYKQDMPKPLWWKLTAVLLMIISLIFGITTPLGAGFEDVKSVSDIPGKESIPTNFQVIGNLEKIEDLEFGGKYLIDVKKPEHIFSVKTETIYKVIVELKNESSFVKLLRGKELIAITKYNKDLDAFEMGKITHINPLFVFPYLPKLEQRIRNLIFHVPMSWIGTLAFALSMAYSILYLRKKKYIYDIKASAAAFVGLILCLLATFTGMVWAKYDWGSYWSGDPRQVSILILIIIYFAYFLFRMSVEGDEKKARLSAVYSIFSFLTVVPLVFIIPRQFESLHPGAKGDGTAGPVLDMKSGMLDSELALSFYFSFCSFLIIFFWIYSLYIRFKKLSYNNV